MAVHFIQQTIKKAYRIFRAVIIVGLELSIKGFKRVIRSQIHRGLISWIRIRKF